ncbi:hypothetical protein Esti_004604 [Eimeria stiedai]
MVACLGALAFVARLCGSILSYTQQQPIFHTSSCFMGSGPLEATVSSGTARAWGAPLLLPALLLPLPPLSRKPWTSAAASAGALSSGAPEGTVSQLPHVVTAEALEELLDVGDSEEEALPAEHPQKVLRDEYKPSAFAVESVRLLLKLEPSDTKVMSRLVIRRLPDTTPQDLVLNGEELILEQLLLNGKVLREDRESGYQLVHGDTLVIPQKLLPEPADTPFELLVDVTINPLRNGLRKGLFMSQDSFITQCEPGGFRRITFFVDRPDILTRFRVRLEADAQLYPVLLSGGNRVGGGVLEWSFGRHFAIFDDPHPKSSDFFGLVAGNFAALRDSFITKSGRLVNIQLLTKPEDVSKLEFARWCVKESMRWDEVNFGREYDLDLLSVVCVENFGGQMANKGLLIFDCENLLADPVTSTDAELNKVLAAVGHECFRNWTGARIPVRDWFQISLNAGLTKFRESLFTGAMTGLAGRRVNGVRYMVSKIFRIDADPRALPLRPESYDDVYELYAPALHWKAAEVIRACQSLLGEEAFLRGMDLYFERHDGKAVTIEDFRIAMEDASGLDLSQFDRWFSEAGTPEITVVEATYKPPLKTFSITFTQLTPPTPSQPTKLPLMIPIKIGLIGKTSKKDILNPPTVVFKLTSEKQTFDILNVKEDCVPSVHREYAAPIKLYSRQTEDERVFLLAYDSDPVNKWRSAQVLFTSFILSRAVVARQRPTAALTPLPSDFIEALRTVLLDADTDSSVKALCLLVPKTRQLSEKFTPTDPDALHRARRSVILDVGSELKTEMNRLFQGLTSSRVSCHDKDEVARRKLRNELLVYLSEPRDREAAQRAFKYFLKADCMTDKFYALMALSSMQQPERDIALARFYRDADGNQRLINGWLSVQASADLPDQFERLERLRAIPSFSFENANSLRFLLFDFVLTNEVHFHRKDGKGYRLLADTVIQIDKIDSQLASRAARLFSGWRKMERERQSLIKGELKRIRETPQLSEDVRKVVRELLLR